MSFLDRFFGSNPEPEENENANEEAIEHSNGHELDVMGKEELARLEESSVRSIVLPAAKKAAQAADALIPLAANAAQAAATYGMAVVKFPEGVTWADLCVRKADGWNLLSNFKDGKFNDMAAIKQAGMQPAAVANLALQGAAVAVGMAYMNEINGKLDSLQSGIYTIQRDMERERDAELKAAFDALARLSLKYEEYGASPEKRQVALQIIEDATREATKAWNYQLDCIRDLTKDIASKKKLSEAQVRKEAMKLSSMEERASVAFQLVAAAQQIGMRLENDYTPKRIESDLQIVGKMKDEFSIAHGDAQLNLSKKASRVNGPIIAIADYVDDGFKTDNVVVGALHKAGKNIDRVSPIRMIEKGRKETREKRAKLQDAISSENIIQTIASGHEEELEALKFAFNEADMLVFDGDKIRLIKSADNEDEPDYSLDS